MLPSSRRVSKILFEKTMRDSKMFHAPHFSLRIGKLPEEKGLSPSTSLRASRFSFVVSKKVAPRATKRNALRRKCYLAVEKLLDTVIPGVVVLVFAKKGAELLTGEYLYKEFSEAFKKAGISS